MTPSLRLQRVLVGVDFSSASLAAARWVATHFANDSELALAHVIALPRVPSYLHRVVETPQFLLEHITPEVHGGLRGLASSLGVGNPRTELLIGLPSERLAAYAEDFGADLVVLGRTGQSNGTWKRIGSTADRLMRQVRVPVLIATGDLATAPRRILAAVDDAGIGTDVLRAAQSLALRFGAELIAMHVVSERVRAYAAAALPVRNGEQVHATADSRVRGAAYEWLTTALRELGPGTMTRAEIRVGDVGNEILAAAEQLDVDLLVVGSYGADAVPRNGTGGVTRFVVRGARRSVLVVGNGPDDRVTARPPGTLEMTNILQYGRRSTSALSDDPGRPPAAVRPAS